MKTKNYFRKAALLFLVGSAQFIMAQVPNYVPTNGLVAYYPFSGNANDASGNANNGTATGANLTADRFGNANSAYNFANTGQNINFFSDGAWCANNHTISLWFNSAYIPGKDQYVLAKRNSCSGGSEPHHFNFVIEPTSNFFSLGWGGLPSTGGASFLNIPFTPNTWNNVVYVRNGVNFYLYLNGVLASSNLNATCPSISCNLMLKAGNHSCSVPNDDYNGKLDDIGLWNRALTSQEVSNMYNQVAPYSDTCNAVSGSLTQGLVSYWPFCGNANDDSGNGNNGTVNGATLTTDRFGNANSAYMFQTSATLQNITTNYTGILGTNNRSISLWFNQNTVDTSTDLKDLCGYGANTSNNQFIPAIYQNRVGLAINNSATYYSPNTFGNWHHYVITYNNTDGNSVQSPKVYLDGILLSTVFNSFNLPGVINTLAGNNFTIGGRILLNQFNGKIDDVGIWNRALSTQEITQLYNQNQCFTNTTVTDTLVINVGQLSYTNPINYANNITIFPNPASTQVNIAFNNISNLNGGSIKIINSLGQQVASTPITTSGTNTTMTLSTWGGSGLYFVQIVNPQGQIVDIKKILLQ